MTLAYLDNINKDTTSSVAELCLAGLWVKADDGSYVVVDHEFLTIAVAAREAHGKARD